MILIFLILGYFRVFLILSMFLNYDGECIVEVIVDCVNVFTDIIKRDKVVGMKIFCIRRYILNFEKRNNNLLIENGR